MKTGKRNFFLLSEEEMINFFIFLHEQELVVDQMMPGCIFNENVKKIARLKVYLKKKKKFIFSRTIISKMEVRNREKTLLKTCGDMNFTKQTLYFRIVTKITTYQSCAEFLHSEANFKFHIKSKLTHSKIYYILY